MAGGGAEAILNEFNTLRNSVRELEDNIIITRRKLNENLIDMKRAEAALADITASTPEKTFIQAGQAFIGVTPEVLTKDLEEIIATNQKQRTQLVEVEARFVERLKGKKSEMQALEQSCKSRLQS